MPVSVVSQQRLLPSAARLPVSKAADSERRSCCVPLSIVDQTLGGGPLAGCVWLWDGSTSGALDVQQLTTSLRHTLAHYPFFCGQLEPRPFNPLGDHTQRLGCLQLRWGEATDPGAELVIARSPMSVATVAPNFTERAERGHGMWINDGWPKAELFSSTQLASTAAEHEGQPCMSVQLTEFACGGLGMSARWPHTLCDMTAIMTFMRNWATVHRALIAGQDATTAITPDCVPRFEPELVDRCAAGDLTDRHQPADEELLKRAAALPRANWDWWATSVIDCPPPMQHLTRIPPYFTAQQVGPLGKAATWLREWEWWQTAQTCLIDFSRSELNAMLHEARIAPQAASGARLSIE